MNADTRALHGDSCLYYKVEAEGGLTVKIADFDSDSLGSITLSKEEATELRTILEDYLTAPAVNPD
jgi:hypothetical protein